MSRAALLSGLLWDPSGTQETAETRKGVPLYDGSASGFETWAYKIGVKLGALRAIVDEPTRDQRLVEYAATIIEGLTDNSDRSITSFFEQRCGGHATKMPRWLF